MALNGKGRVAVTTVDRVLSAAAELGYHADPAARAVRLGHSNTLGLVVRNLSNSYFLDIVRGMDEVCAKFDYSVLIMNSDYDYAQEQSALDRMARSRVAGLAIAPIGGSAAIQRWQTDQPNAPLVVVNSAPRIGEVTVGPDGPQAVELALGEFRRHGHQRVAYVGAPQALQADTDRLQRFRELAEDWQIQPEFLFTALTFDSVRDQIGRSLDDPDGPRAFLMNSDYAASAVYAAAHDRGLQVGREVSVIGHDAIPTSPLFAPPMTTIHVDRVAVGQVVARSLLQMIAGSVGQTCVLPTSLARGKSVANLSG